MRGVSLRGPVRNRHLALLVLALAAAAIGAVILISRAASGQVVFAGLFTRGIRPWTSAGGGAQCANYGTPSHPPRLRGSLKITRLGGVAVGRFTLPRSQPPSFPLQACELVRPTRLVLGAEDYYGLSFYVPSRWRGSTTATGSFWGITISQFHFQNIWGSPIVFELHSNHLTLALETGSCNDHLTSNPGCSWRSNADAPKGSSANLRSLYAIPPPLAQGAWHQVIMRVRWAANSSGAIQVWTRRQGATDWRQTVDFAGYPTVQWDRRGGCCTIAAADKIGAYRGPSVMPVSVWLGGMIVGTSFQAVARALPSD